jgi:hypothetical protein
MKKNMIGLMIGIIVSVSLIIMPVFSSPALAKPSITIHNIIDLTGAYAPIAIPSEKGGKDYLSWVAERGGLDVDGDGKGDVEVQYKWA